jgi:hypothetical protein
VTAPHLQTHEPSAPAPPTADVTVTPRLVDIVLTTTIVVLELVWVAGLAGLIAFAIWR